jgi:26S proteasome regulatory subunit N7
MESYKTVRLNNMAEAFGVSIDFIDRELSELIASRRLACKIDKVEGIVETDRIDERNNLYK